MQYLYIKSSIGIRCNTYTLKASWIFDAIHWKGNKDWTWGAQNRVLWCLCITKNWKLLFGRFERTSDICICDAIVRIEKMEMWPISIMANVGEVTDGLWARCWPWQPTTYLPTSGLKREHSGIKAKKVLLNGTTRPLFVYFRSLKINNTIFTAPGFKLTTSCSWVSSLNH